MNTYITLACLLAVVATGHGSAVGWGGMGGMGGLGGLGGLSGLGGWGGYGGVQIIKAPILGPAISTQNMIKAAPIPIIKSVAVAPIITAPVLHTVPVSTIGWGMNGGLGYGLGGYGLGGLGGHGLGGLSGHGLGGLGYSSGMWGMGKH